VQVTLSDPIVMEIYGAAGYDWIVIDTEHAAHTPLSVRAMLQAAAHTGAVPVVRILRLDEGEIGRMLDIGAAGILCPFINSALDARTLAAACRYPPVGRRGWGPRRAAGFGLETTDHAQLTHDALIAVAMIESVQAVENIEEIVATDGISGIMVGAIDLSIDLGAAQDYGSQRFTEAVARVRGACRDARMPMGVGAAGIEQAAEFVVPGDQLLLIGGDDLALANDARRTVAAMRAPRPQGPSRTE
jgi:4-hydroxy-2-oxoheptanedioate aldolase